MTDKASGSTLPAPVQRTAALGASHVAGVLAFPGLGTLLLLNDVPPEQIYPMLGISGAIGVVVVLAASGGRRVLTALAVLLRAGQ
ncbi:hypothetical protein [Streptomyces sp. NPDC059247]|uniref:hypothetical protein n=1 Tax=Streptomyces sp. NPDC059247 TaxID=3346790 RepID=UPI0036B13038